MLLVAVPVVLYLLIAYREQALQFLPYLLLLLCPLMHWFMPCKGRGEGEDSTATETKGAEQHG